MWTYVYKVFLFPIIFHMIWLVSIKKSKVIKISERNLLEFLGYLRQ